MVPKTAYQEWIQPILTTRAMTTDDLAQAIGRQQSIVWRVVNGDPIKYPSAKRPGYELAYEIGNALGLLAESLAAAGHSLAPVSTTPTPTQRAALADATLNAKGVLYRCNAKVHAGRLGMPVCDARSITGAVEEAVWGEVVKRLQSRPEEDFQQVEKARGKKSVPRQDSGVHRLRVALDAKPAEIAAVARLLRRGTLTEAEADVQIAEIRAEESDLRAHLDALLHAEREREQEAARLERVEESKKELRELVAGHPSNEIKRQVMREIGLRVIVHTHGHRREATTSLEIQCKI